jgi:hypothetical protein
MMNAALLHGVDWECKKMNIFTGSLLEFGLCMMEPHNGGETFS